METVLFVISAISLLVTLLPFIKAPFGLIRIWEFPRLQIVFLLMLSVIGWTYFWPASTVEWILAGALLAALLFQLYTILPYTPLWKKQISSTKVVDDQNSVTIMFYNVYQFNQKTQPFLDLVKKKNPDILLLVETDRYWTDHLQELKETYRYFEEVPIDNTYGMVLYSRLELRGTEVKYLLKDDIPSIHTYIHLPSGRFIKLYCVHPEPPGLQKSTVDRDAELLQVAKMIEKKQEPTVVAGDLNDVAWSDSTNLFGKISKCNDPRIGRGLLNSFHAKILFMRWPLDHFFLSNHFTVDLIERQPAIGSDHFPMLIRFTYTHNGNEGTGTKPADPSEKQEANEKIEEGKEQN